MTTQQQPEQVILNRFVNFGPRIDGKVNVWGKIDMFINRFKVRNYSSRWIVIDVRDTLEEANRMYPNAIPSLPL